MAIIGKVERKNWKVKLLNVSIHVILLLGAVTMVYPLLIMISGSIKSDVDFFKFSLLPEYVYDTGLLYKKYLLTKYNNINVMLFNDFRLPAGSIINIPIPESPSFQRYQDYKVFLSEMREKKPHYWRGIGMAFETGVTPLSLREFRNWMMQKYGKGEKGIDALNKARGTDFSTWESVFLPVENFHARRAFTTYDSGILPDSLEYKNSQISGLHTYWIDLDGYFTMSLRQEYGNNLKAVNKAFGTKYNSWMDISFPVTYPEKNPALAKYWSRYVKDSINPCFVSIDKAAAPSWTEFLKKKYNNNLPSFNTLYGTRLTSFSELPMPETMPGEGQLKTDWSSFILDSLPPKYLQINSIAGAYRHWLQDKFGTLGKVNSAYELGYNSFDKIDLPSESVSDNLAKNADWEKFITSLNPEETGLSRNAINSYRDFIIRKYQTDGVVDFKRLSLDFKHNVRNKHEIPFYSTFPVSPQIGSRVKDLYTEFITQPENVSLRLIPCPDKLKPQWHKFLKTLYPDIGTLNKAWGMVYTDWEKISPPTAEYEWFQVLANKALLIKEYLKRNYLMVFDTIQTNGFAAKNTVIYCCLAVLAALIVNPLCAYGLSRFKMAPAYKILLFLMLPMAFPAMVLGIPQFLLIKKLGLLNTFAALILPAMANGYMIFLLKGFFDSLPKELFESAAIDGASEWTVFWHIAMGLSTPILSVLALNTFTAAYGNFMMAFLLCQDQSMWTMMVYLYQLQQRTSQAVGFAALIIAAIPTLLVFIFCQNIIIKGIVVPTEK
ncbi:MAG: Lactose transport system permease protein LacG [Lentisphaerae bacterium ADurb.Bin242]|nr:MAG: Lactose transport system permease protein LacG [Lentisphaerae bacterium ADurb.Bin242]